MDDCKADIAEAKLVVMKNEVRKAKAKRDLELSEVALKDRRALFLQFDHAHNKKLKALNGACGEKVRCLWLLHHL